MTTAAVLAFGTATSGAHAQEPEAPPSTSEVTPAPTSEPSTPPSTTEPAPPSTSEPVSPPSVEPVPSSEPSAQPPAPSTPAETSHAPARPTGAEQENQPRTTVAEKPNLKVTASIDKDHYASHERVKVKVTVTNLSPFPAERVRGTASGLQVSYGGWGTFEYPGTTLAAGETRTVEFSGAIARLNGDRLDLSVYVLAEVGDSDHNDNFVSFEPTVTKTFGSVRGTAYADANRNGALDPGEPLAGGIVSIYGGSPSAEHRTTTDENGLFEFTNVLTGVYSPYYELPGGWVVHLQPGLEQFAVEPNRTTSLEGRAWRPYSELLTATASLDRSTYAYPATAKVTVTLTNTSQYRLDDIQAGCNRAGNSNHFDGGAEWNAVFGPGVDLVAGETKTFVFTEPVPEGASQAGDVWLSCDFQPNPGWNTDGPRASASATVTGGKGRLTMHLADDRDEDHMIDPGEEVAGLKIVLLNPGTGAQVAEAVSNAQGTLEFVDVPVGTYRAAILGPWDFRYGPDMETQQVVGWGSTVFVGLKAVSGPAELRATLTLDKPRYESHETVKATLKVTNTGGRVAERVRLPWSLSGLEVPEAQWGDFRPNGPGVRLLAGESRTFEVSGTIRDFTNGKLNIWGYVDYLGVPNPTNSNFRAEAEVVQTKGSVSGVAYADRNRNGQQDAGEATAGVVVEANGGAPYGYFKTTTGADGRFSFAELPSGEYYVGFTFADGWVVHYEGRDQKVQVRPGAPVEVIARGERPYSESLSATLTLDQDVYEPGEDAKITITLTNRGDRAISGITAYCNGVGNSNQLGDSTRPNPGWGELFGAGVTVGAGETKTVVAIEAVPQGAFTYGTVVAACLFAPYAGWNMDGVGAFDTARVPGGFGSLTGELYFDRNGDYRFDEGEALPGTRIVLRDRELGVDVAETVSDDKGNVRFDKVPAGDFWAWVDGPWKFRGEYDGHVQVFAGSESRSGFPVVADPRPEPGDSPEPAAAAGGSSGTGGTGGALAKTGASVLGLGLLGALLVAFGFGASMIGRRRRIA
ncbi:SdrD B-like domain-containing protein [Lentzea albida]|uniref:SdrD B-like domain-containing protein n=1 Tax=Lentzea albida TaxID=65499 RepID=UPI000B7EC2FE|nr:SdrD B-like domain-containing protein [Lentzea albida]